MTQITEYKMFNYMSLQSQGGCVSFLIFMYTLIINCNACFFKD